MKTRSGKTAVVVELGTDWLKIAAVANTSKGSGLAKLHLVRWDGSGTSSAAIASAFKQLQLVPKAVTACLPRHMVTIRMLELPSTDPQEIADMIDLRAAKETPHSPDEIVSDYWVAGESRRGYTRVLLAIAQRTLLRDKFYILEEAGLEVARMAVSSEGIVSWYRHVISGGNEAVAVLDLDSSYSDLTIIANEELVFTKSILVGASQLLAEEANGREKFRREVRQALDAFQDEVLGVNPTRLLISGAGAAVPNLAAELETETGLKTETRDPLQGITLAAGCAPAGDTAEREVSLTAVVGLGLQSDGAGINLMPDSVRMRRHLVMKARSLTVLGSLIIAVLISVSVYALAKLSLKQRELAAVCEEVLQTLPIVRELERKREVVKAVRTRENPQTSALHILSAINELKGDAVLESVDLALDRNQVTIEGSVEAMRDVFALEARLEQSVVFKDVKEGRPAVKDEKSGRYRFQIVCALEGET